MIHMHHPIYIMVIRVHHLIYNILKTTIPLFVREHSSASTQERSLADRSRVLPEVCPAPRPGESALQIHFLYAVVYILFSGKF